MSDDGMAMIDTPRKNCGCRKQRDCRLCLECKKLTHVYKLSKVGYHHFVTLVLDKEGNGFESRAHARDCFKKYLERFVRFIREEKMSPIEYCATFEEIDENYHLHMAVKSPFFVGKIEKDEDVKEIWKYATRGKRGKNHKIREIYDIYFFAYILKEYEGNRGDVWKSRMKIKQTKKKRYKKKKRIRKKPPVIEAVIAHFPDSREL
ncbi:MAG: hypothetical protein ABIH66_00050 [bacterium]